MRSAAYVLTQQDMIEAIRKDFAFSYKRAGFVLLVFMEESNRFKAILNQAEHWNRFSAGDLTVLFPGYYGALSNPGGKAIPLSEASALYDRNAFEDVSSFFTENSDWKNRGICQILALEVQLNHLEGDPDWIFESCLDFAIEDLPPSFDLNAFICELVFLAREAREKGELSDKLSMKNLKKQFAAALSAALPKQLTDAAKKFAESEKMRVKDLRRKVKSPT